MENAWMLPVLGLTLLGLGFYGAPLWAWTLVIAAGLYGFQAEQACWFVFGVVAAVFNIAPIRQWVLSLGVFKLMKALKFIPTISETEAIALKAGDVWIERELFSGKPSFKKLMEQTYPKLTAEEQAFIDGPVEKLCAMTSDWKVWQTRDLPPEVWAFMKKERFFGMIIPKEHGGLGFSALAHSEVIHKLASRSIPLAVTAMVPNSLGPAELLTHYGTDAQKKHYLPRLAVGEEIPCFALTEPNAGSDAGSIQATGVLFKGPDGKLHIRLNWNKRWITLAAVSTVVGMAFRLKDPDGLVGDKKDLGITCALIPSSTPGVVLGKRHDPLGCPFYNCPTQGNDVVVPVDAIIGGLPMAGQGWKMLMESLGAGRGISLPAQSAGGMKLLTRGVSAHASVRRQFGMSIGRFEGVQEALARIGGFSYMVEAARRYTLGALDHGHKPPVVTALMKYYTTELSRRACIDGMDIVGGQAITLGPRNWIAHAYISLPIQITVEGANILTRTLIVFGQGALRAHPYAFKEVDAIEQGDVKAFDRAFWAHIGHVIRNTIRTLLLSLTRGYLIVPHCMDFTARYYRRLGWCSATFALFSDILMGTLGGKLKARGKTTGRMADILGHMYMATSVLRRFEADGRPEIDKPYVKWTLDYCFSEIQKAFDGIFGSMDGLIGLFFRGPIRWYSSLNPIGVVPSDELDFKIANLMQIPGEQRDRHTVGIFVPKTDQEQLGKLEHAFVLSASSESAAHKVKRAVRKKQLAKKPAAELYADALKAQVISQAEFDSIAQAEALRNDVIQVDSFTLDEYKANEGPSAS